MSLTLFSPFSGSDSFLQLFINILALVVQKMGQVSVSVPIQQFWKAVTNDISGTGAAAV